MSCEWWNSSTLGVQEGGYKSGLVLNVAVLLGDFRTDVPAVMGIVMSNTMILAVKVVASGTTDVGGHSTLPTFK